MHAKLKIRCVQKVQGTSLWGNFSYAKINNQAVKLITKESYTYFPKSFEDAINLKTINFASK